MHIDIIHYHANCKYNTIGEGKKVEMSIMHVFFPNKFSPLHNKDTRRKNDGMKEVYMNIYIYIYIFCSSRFP